MRSSEKRGRDGEEEEYGRGENSRHLLSVIHHMEDQTEKEVIFCRR
jgi:hypothetical protein